MSNEFHRIRRLPPYVFEEVNRSRRGRAPPGDDIIDFGMGNPDMPTPKHIVDKLVETARDPRSHRYSASQGHPRPAQGAWPPITSAASASSSIRTPR